MTPQPKEQSHSALPSIEKMRESFEACIHSSDKFKDNTPLGVATINGEFHHYMEPDTDTMWIGFGLGYRSHFKASHARLLAQNEMLRKALKDIVDECPNPKLPYGLSVAGIALAALEQAERK